MKTLRCDCGAFVSRNTYMCTRCKNRDKDVKLSDNKFINLEKNAFGNAPKREFTKFKVSAVINGKKCIGTLEPKKQSYILKLIQWMKSLFTK